MVLYYKYNQSKKGVLMNIERVEDTPEYLRQDVDTDYTYSNYYSRGKSMGKIDVAFFCYKCGGEVKRAGKSYFNDEYEYMGYCQKCYCQKCEDDVVVEVVEKNDM